MQINYFKNKKKIILPKQNSIRYKKKIIGLISSIGKVTIGKVMLTQSGNWLDNKKGNFQ